MGRDTCSNYAMRATAHIRLAAAALLLAACDRSSELPYDNHAQTIVTIADLKARCTRTSVAVTEDIAVRGIVVGNDLFGEFPNTLVLQDASGGITIATEGSMLSNHYPIGTCATILCNGLVLTEYGGKIQLGTTPGQYGAGRIPSSELARYIRLDIPGERLPEPLRLRFSDISMQHIDRYVLFSDVRFTQTGSWCDTDPQTLRPTTTERMIADHTGNTFILRTAGSCTYAKEPVPQGTGSIGGIIDYFNGKFTLRVTNREAFVNAARSPRAYP